MELSNITNILEKILTHFSKINKIIIFSEITWQYKAKLLQSYYEDQQIEIRKDVKSLQNGITGF